MSIKLTSTMFSEGIRQDPETFRYSLINVYTSFAASIAHDAGYDDFEVPPLVASFVFTREDESDSCDDLAVMDATVHVLLDEDVAPGYERPRPITIRIGEGQISTVETFNLPGLRFSEIPKHKITRRSYSIIIRTNDGRELGRAVMRILFDRRFGIETFVR